MYKLCMVGAVAMMTVLTTWGVGAQCWSDRKENRYVDIDKAPRSP
jgi:hypothetical protein